MAEPVGLALGAVALASLFSTCVELMEYFELSKSYKYDYELACLKLSLLKARLDTWGQTVDVNNRSQEDTDLREQWSSEQDVVRKSLQGIAGIFGDAEQLKSKYTVLPRRWKIKASLYRSGSSRAIQDKPRRRLLGYGCNISLVRRSTSWAIRDKGKFDILINDLDFFISNLEAVSFRLHTTSIISPEMSSKGSESQAAGGANRGAHRTSSRASRPIMVERKDSHQSMAEVCSETSDSQSKSSSRAEEGYTWYVGRMEDRSAVFYGNVDGAKLEPAPQGQVVSYRVEVTKDNARVMGGAMSSTDFNSFFNGGAPAP
ncbi:MAG: hypothetical protein Q9165_005473 [Trypethelium subeluteriae]